MTGILARAALLLVPARWRESVSRDLADEAARDGRRGAGRDLWFAWHALRVALRFRRHGRLENSAAGQPAPFAWNLGTDCRLAWRALRREPASALAVVLTLALGTGAATATYAVMNYALLRPVPGVQDEDSLVSVYTQVDASTSIRSGITFAHLEAMRDQSPALSGLAAWNSGEVAITTDPAQPPHVASFVTVTRGFFETLGVRPKLGRLFTLDEYESPGVNRVVISERFWRRMFDADASIVGRQVQLRGHPFEIIGVVRAYQGLDRLRHEDGWLPDASRWTFDPSEPRTRDRWASASLVGRLAPGASLTAAQAQLMAAFRAVGERRIGDRTFWPYAFSGPSDGVGLTRSRLAAVLRIMFGGVALLLVLACANAANLMLARHVRRRSDLAVRQALGAGRSRLVRELLVEAGALALGACLLGLGLAAALAAMFRTSRLLSYLPVLDELSLDWRVAAFCAAASALTILLFALAPALLATRAEMRTAVTGGRATRRTGALRMSLVGAQIALSLTLVVAGALLAQSVRGLQSADFGFDPDAVVRFSFRPNRAGYDDAAGTAAMERLLERLAETPGLGRAALAFFSPLGGVSRSTVRAAGSDEASAAEIGSHDVTSDYFDVLGIPVLQGRTFTLAEARSRRVDGAPIILNRLLGERLFGSAPAVGQTILQRGRAARGVVWQPRTIVGVVGNALGGDVREGFQPHAYEPFGSARVALVLVRPDVPFARAADLIRQAARDAAAAVPVENIAPLRVEADEEIAQERVLSRLSLVIAAVAGLITLVGLYAAVAQLVGERTREFAIRTAIGATKATIAAALLRRVARVAVGGLAMGGVLVWLSTSALASYLFGVSPRDPLTVAAAAIGLGATALAAVWPAVRRATRVDPAVALRSE